VRQLILHFGLFKTATTWLQEDVFPKVEGYHYVQKALYRHSLLKTLLLTDYLVFKGLVESVREGFLKLMDGNENIILSHEIFSGNPYFQSVNRTVLLNKLRLLFPEAKILFAFRGQKPMVDSLYREYVVQGGVKSFEDFVFNPRREPRSILGFDPHLDLEIFKYGAYIDYIHELFGKENAFVFPYERLKKDPLSFLQDLSSFLGANLDPKHFTPEVRREGLGDLQIQVLRRLNQFFKSALHQRGLIPYKPKFNNFFRITNRFHSDRTLFSARHEFPIDYTMDNDALDEKYHYGLRKDFAWAYYI